MALSAELKKQLGILDMEDVKEAWDVLKARHTFLAQVASLDFRPGENVSFEGRRGQMLSGKVVRVNQSSVSVDVDGIPWKVASTLLKKQ